MQKKIIIAFTFIVCLNFSGIFSMEDGLGEHCSMVARNLHEMYDKNGAYLGLFQDMLKELTTLSYKEQVNALSYMINEVIDKNWSLTKKFCLVVMDLYESKIRDTESEEIVRNLIIEKIILPGRKQKVFTRLKNLCSLRSSAQIAQKICYEKEKEKETTDLDSIAGEFVGGLKACGEIFSCNDSDLSKDIIVGLLNNYSTMLLKDQPRLLRNVQERLSDEPIIAKEVGKYAQLLQKLLDDNASHSAVSSLHNNGFYDRNRSYSDMHSGRDHHKDVSPMEHLLDEASKVHGPRRHTIIVKVDSSLACKPYFFDRFVFLPQHNGLVDCYDLKEKLLVKTYMTQNNEPLFFADENYSIPDLVTETLCPPSFMFHTISVYFNAQENRPTRIHFEYPYLVRAYENGSLEIDNIKDDEHFSFREKHAGEITGFTMEDSYKLFSGSTDKTIKVWDLKDKKYIKVFPCNSAVKSIALYNPVLVYLTENALIGIHLDNGTEFYAPFDVTNVVTLKVRDDGLLMGMKDGKLKFIEHSDKEPREPRELDIRIQDPITDIYSMGETIIAQSACESTVLHLPFD